MPFRAYSDLIDTLTPSKMHFGTLMLFITRRLAPFMPAVALWGSIEEGARRFCGWKRELETLPVHS